MLHSLNVSVASENQKLQKKIRNLEKLKIYLNIAIVI